MDRILSRERTAFASHDGRICGVERDTELGIDTDTRTFFLWSEAGDWIDDLRAAQDIARVRAAGGTLVVFA